jgi:heme/copper-type cytochrome/quinol oxidase subunit 2
LVETEFLPSFFFFSEKSDLNFSVLVNEVYFFNNDSVNFFDSINIPNSFYFDDTFLFNDTLLFDEIITLDNLNYFDIFEHSPTYDLFLDNSLDLDSSFINNNVEFVSSINNDSFMIADNDLVLGQQRVLDTDSHLIVSSLRSTKFLVNALDVLHSFVILSTGIKVDAIVGRINEMSVFFLREGLFFGQCSELCGSGHFGMPIVVESLEPFDFFGYFEDKK